MVQYQNPYLANPYLPLYNQGQPMMPQAMQYQQPVDGIVKVNGRESAMQYQLPPNSTSPALFDQSGTCFYVVSTDGTGTKSIECFDFSSHVEQQVLAEETLAWFLERHAIEVIDAVSASLGRMVCVDGTCIGRQ